MTKKKMFFTHEKALVETDQVGQDTRIWAFAHILKGARIGAHCNIGDHCFIESDVVVGNNVTIKNGISLWDRVRIADDVFLGPNAAFTNVVYPRSGVRDNFAETVVEKGATIGANATVVCGVRIGRYALVGAGSVVTKEIAPYALVYGNPAVVRGYVCRCAKKLVFTKNRARCACGLAYEKKNGQVLECI